MRGRTLLTVSLIANVVLAAAWFWSARQIVLRTKNVVGATTPSIETKTNVVIRRQFFSWEQVESDDYQTYIANLRDIGCPEQTIKDIIVADVNQLYAQRRAKEIPSADQQWWRSERDPGFNQDVISKSQELDGERRTLLTRLLGSDSGTAGKTAKQTPDLVPLEGPVLGEMSGRAKQQVRDILSRAEEQAKLLGLDGSDPNKKPDPAEEVRFEQKIWSELAGILSPQQLEEFRLRYSPSANDLRGELGKLEHFDATPDEFRNLFHAVDAVDMQMRALEGKDDPDSRRQLQRLQQQRDGVIKNALSPERYAQYRMLQDEAYRSAVTAAQQADSPVSAPALYEINKATADEMARIRTDTNLTDSQRTIELKKAELEQLKAATAALGQQLPPEPQAPPPPKRFAIIPHILTTGENLNSLTTLYSISPDALRNANPDLNFDRLKAGDTVKVPYLPPPP